MRKSWLRRHYRNQPLSIRGVLINEHLNRNLKVLASLKKRHPDNYVVLSRVAELLVGLGRSQEAIRVWHKTCEKFRRQPAPYFQRAHWALMRRDFAEAEKYLRLCIARDRGYFGETAYFWRAESLFRLGRHKEALDAIQYVKDDYREQWFLDYRSRSRSDLLKDIQAGMDS